MNKTCNFSAVHHVGIGWMEFGSLSIRTLKLTSSAIVKDCRWVKMMKIEPVKGRESLIIGN